MTQKEVEQGIGILFKKLTIVENNRLIYKQLTELCGIGKQFECVMKKSNCFWKLTISSICFSITAELAKIYDEHNDAFGIKKLINISSQNSDWFSKWYNEYGITHKDFIKQLEIKYNNIEKKREKLKEIRDSELAHNDRKNLLNIETIYEGFSWGDIEDLIETAYDIMNSISVGLTRIEYFIQADNYDDVKVLIRNAYKGMYNIDKLNN